MSGESFYIATAQEGVPNMKVVIGLLVLCGIYSTHSASLGILEASPCDNQDDGTFLPVMGDCSEFIMCLKGETFQSSCGSGYHFDPVGKQCIEISRSLCVSGKQSINLEPEEEVGESKLQHVVVKQETKPETEEVKSEQKVQVQLQHVELKPQHTDSKLQPEEVKAQQVELKLDAKPQQVELNPEVKPQPEEVKLQQSQPQQAELKLDAKPQQIELKPELKPQPEEVKLQQSQSQQAALELDAKPQQIELKPELKPQPEEVKLQQSQPQQAELKLEVKPQQVELKPEVNSQPEEVKLQQSQLLHAEEAKPQDVISNPQYVELKHDAKPEPENVKLQQSQPQQAELKLEAKPQQVELKPELKPQPEEVKLQQSQPQQAELKLEVKPQQIELKPELKPQPEDAKLQQSQPQQTEQKPQPAKVNSQQTQSVELKPDTKPQQENSKPQQTAALRDSCIGKAVGSFVPSKVNCNEYYVCLGNRIVLKNCPTGLHFNPDVLSCTIPSLANCLAEPESQIQVEQIPAEKKPQEQEQPKKKQDPSEIVPISAETVCSGQANGAMFVIPGSCTKYFACLREKAFEFSCGVRHFDPESRACVQAEESRCVEGEVAVVLDVAVKQAEQLGAEIIGDTNLGSGNDGVVVGNANVQVANTGTLNNVNLISASDTVAVGNTDLGYRNEYEVSISSSSGQNKSKEATASLDNTAHFNAAQIRNSSVGNTDLGQNNSGISVGSANVNINNTGTVSNANFVVASQNVEVGNTDLGSWNSYNVSGGNLLINSKVVPIKQSGLPVNKKQISQIDQIDVDVSSSGISVNAEGVAESKVNAVGNTDLGQANKGISIASANINITNSGSVSDVNVVSGVQNSVVGNTDLGSYNEVTANGISIPDPLMKENKEVVVAVIDEDSSQMCDGVPSETLFPRFGDCSEFLTCKDGVAYVGVCPHGLHFNAAAKVCDWPENAGCV